MKTVKVESQITQVADNSFLHVPSQIPEESKEMDEAIEKLWNSITADS